MTATGDHAHHIKPRPGGRAGPLGAACCGRHVPDPARRGRSGLHGYEPPGMSCTIRSQEDDVPGVPPENLSETDLLRELEHLHTTRHGTFLHGAPDALREHSSRTAQLEEEYLRRHPEREVDPARTRSGARGDDGSARNPRR